MHHTKWDAVAILNGVLCGLVAVTGNCAVTDPWAAIVIGAISSVWYAITLRLCDKLKIDDPSEAIPIHGPCGAWGIFATAFFDKTNGVIYGNSGMQIGVQLLGIVVIIAWDVICCLIVLMPLKLLAKYTKLNLLRASPEEELQSIDYYNHAYVPGRITKNQSKVLDEVDSDDKAKVALFELKSQQTIPDKNENGVSEV